MRPKNVFVGKVKNNLSVMFIVLLIAVAITAITYYLLSNIFYHPGDSAFGGREVFLYPRYFPPQNDLSSAIFPLWEKAGQLLLLKYSLAILAVFMAAYHFGYKKVRGMLKFLFWIYLLALINIFLFLGFTPSGFGHVEKQANSINNGMRYVMTVLFSPDKGLWSKPESKMWTTSAQSVSQRVESVAGAPEVSLFKKFVYLFNTYYGNKVNYVLLGTTHPLGNMALAFILFKTSAMFPNPAVAWGIIVTLINTLLILVIALIATQAFSARMGKLTALMMLVVPSVTMQFCALIDIIGTLFTATGFLLVALTIKKLYTHPGLKSLNLFNYGLLTSLPFFLSAQISYGNMIPIALALVSFVAVAFEKIKKFPFYWLGLSLVPLFYLIAEYIVSSGNSCYFLRAAAIANEVGNYLLSWRSYAVSQFANFVVLSVIGGILYLPVLINALSFSASSALSFLKRQTFSPVRANYRRKIRLFLSLIACGSLLYLLVQKSIRLEIERIVHWAFICAWPLMGVYFISLRVTLARLLGRRIRAGWPVLIFGIIQLIISIVLALCLQDYC